MIWLGSLLAICSVPGWVGATIPTQWAALSILFPLSLWRTGSATILHWLGSGFLAYAVLALAWTPNLQDAIGGLWQYAIVALAFWFGSTLSSVDTRRLVQGLALGLTVSVILSLGQWYGWSFVLTDSVNSPSGLFFSRVIYGQVLALAIVACLVYKVWWFIPGAAIGIALSGSRGACVTLAIGTCGFLLRKPLALTVIILALSLAFTTTIVTSDLQRLQFWVSAATGVSWLGYGPGSWFGFWEPGRFVIGNVHNDYLQLVYEFGIGASPILLVYALSLTRATAADWPIFLAFAASACFSFPLYSPLPAAIGAICAGRIARDWGLAWDHLIPRRYDFVQRRSHQ